MAIADPRIVCVSASSGSLFGVGEFAARFPRRYFRVANTEQHAVTFAAGLAAEGRRPVVSISSGLLQRAYDQIIHDVALQNLPVLFAVDGAGMVDSTAAGQHGSFDISYLRCLPGLTLATPGDENECRQLLFTASTLSGPAVVRFPNGSGPGTAEDEPLGGWPVGRGAICRDGRSGLALLVFGAPLTVAHRVAQRFDATLISMRFVKPLDEQLLQQVCAGHGALVTIEENALRGGAGSAVGQLLAMKRLQVPLLQLGIPDRFMPSGTRDACLATAGLDFAGLSATIERWWRAQQHQLRVAGGA
jgi:1-deoxy-D-xylulose-5-phosphate synthase